MNALVQTEAGVSEELIDFPTLFRRQVQATPDNLAVHFEDQAVNYQQLDELSDGVAQLLLDAGVARQQCVGLSMDRSVNAIAAMLGVMKVGAVFVPLDPELPGNRLDYIIQDSGIQVILADQEYHSLFSAQSTTLLNLEDVTEANHISVEPSEPEDLAYIMYTSGSTGNPKGVQIDHRGLATYCFADIEIFTASFCLS